MGIGISQEKGLISIVIPTYNYGEFIIEALNSLTKQTFKYLEVIVIDDGSTDGTMNIVENWQMSHVNVFHRFIYLRLPRNCSSSWALNIGFYLAGGEFVVIHDADDISKPDKLRQQFLWLRDHPECAAVGTNFNILRNSIESAFFQNWLNFDRQQIAINYKEKAQHCVCFGTLMFRKDVLVKVAGVKKIPEIRNDIIFIGEMINNNYIVDNIDSRLFSVRLHYKQKSGPKDFQKNSFNIFQRRVSMVIPVRFINSLPTVMYRASLQVYSEIEIIIIDDSGQKQTEQLVNAWRESYARKNFTGPIKNIIYLRLPVKTGNPGLYNIGSYLAKGKYIFFAGNNSLIEKNELTKKVMILDDGWPYSGIAANSQGKILPLNWRNDFLHTNINSSNDVCANRYISILLRQDVIERTAGLAGGFNLLID